MNLSDFLDLLKALAPVGAVIVFLFAFFQYRRSEAWKKTEFVANLYKEFANDEHCQQAIWFLQGDKRTIYYKQGKELVSEPSEPQSTGINSILNNFTCAMPLTGFLYTLNSLIELFTADWSSKRTFTHILGIGLRFLMVMRK